MALTVKNPEVERLAEEVARLTGETKTEAIRKALLERKARLLYPQRPSKESVLEFLEREVWAKLPPESLGKAPTKAEQEEILGFGPEGY
ncbi:MULTISPECIES: type II toxin-antitoxin system VapB family antitoxin [Meiothermus]|jgi:antitoxin VapB|uniref:Protein transcription factor n=2 Tax=Meiothermus TaxID=65551 RepID=D3PLA4_MEIRD|nr:MULTISPECIES: type II toxin-antitoxin system VapB family antitoxin [Meiothermus]ADD27000.1 Rv0623 family protein transcription factor [Meiothermus ruber DSM 1279]AGK03454.1 protein transcription factor [Meiothermus ruber DSM 1279]MCL6530838.1 type II toxin-antitoxin system VapB family antitoxin [Meiothermus ruber]MCX7802995.1 type II toxin-antitoxin system VapB family antitoxin [Meiothermus ruber]RIH79887.1 putative antitoxin VapB36 [Meiothermus taiwanensis]